MTSLAAMKTSPKSSMMTVGSRERGEWRGAGLIAERLDDVTGVPIWRICSRSDWSHSPTLIACLVALRDVINDGETDLFTFDSALTDSLCSLPVARACGDNVRERRALRVAAGACGECGLRLLLRDRVAFTDTCSNDVCTPMLASCDVIGSSAREGGCDARSWMERSTSEPSSTQAKSEDVAVQRLGGKSKSKLLNRYW